MNFLENYPDKQFIDPCHKELVTSSRRSIEPAWGHGRYDFCEDTVTLLKCGQPSSVVIPAVTAAITSTVTPVASLVVNTRCLKDPKIKFEFSSFVTVPVAAVLLSLSFQIFRSCNGSPLLPVGPAFLFSETVSVLGSTPVSFSVCDGCGDTCGDDCCVYTVQVTNTSALTLIGLTVNNASLSAIVVGEPVKDYR